MGALTVTLPQSLMDKLDQVARKTDLPAKMLDAAAEVMMPELKRRLHSSIKNESSGDLEKSITKGKAHMDSKGVWREAIYFDGYDKKGIPNARKAMSMEWGTSNQVAAPFIRPTKESKNSEAIAAEQAVYDKEVG